jgi:prepilin-type N-terminal cleavage/methylation domain-containing protein
MIRGPDTERAFTLIEMIIVLVLLGLAMGAIFPAIGNMMRSGSRSSSIAQASSEAGMAARFLESDVKKALGARGTGERTDTNVVGASAATIPALAQANANMSDIRIAGPTRLVINADVVPSVAGIEQVDWQLLTGTNAVCGDVSRYTGRNWCIRRTVRSAAAGQLFAETLAKGRGDYPSNITSCASGLPAIPVRLFCYEEAMPGAGGAANYAGSWTANCREVVLPDGPNAANAQLTPASPRFATVHNLLETYSIARVDRIVTVNASIYAGGGYGKTSELSYEHASITIRSHEGEAYREAIMCGTKARWGQ